ncbi:MAG TPA: trypco2 family protein [Mycobacteriales bacterium]|nr:trypco2 family protein [Mycobacteriales bacterium]
MIELASVVQDPRAELERAIIAAEGEAPHCELGPIELEVSVALKRTGHAGAKVRFWVVESGADAAVGATSTQRIKTQRIKTQRIKLALQPTLTGSNSPPFTSGLADAHKR